MSSSKVFWLHIKKSAGQTVRQVLSPEYQLCDRAHYPANFIQSHKNYYNDILNNYRVPLGNFQLSRSLFAKKFLYSPNEWNEMHKFAFVRNPEERAVSAFKYLYLFPPARDKIYFRLKDAINHRTLFSLSRRFDFFLDTIELVLNSKSNFEPHGLHFKTHVAPMYEDVADGLEILLDDIVPMEKMKPYLSRIVLDYFGRKVDWSTVENRNKTPDINFSLNKGQKSRLRQIYSSDFELYESF